MALTSIPAVARAMAPAYRVTMPCAEDGTEHHFVGIIPWFGDAQAMHSTQLHECTGIHRLRRWRASALLLLRRRTQGYPRPNALDAQRLTEVPGHVHAHHAACVRLIS